MSHSFVSCAVHCVFGTKLRKPYLASALRERLFPYVTEAVRELRVQILASGGIENHIHLLLKLPADVAISKAVQLVKGSSSRWIHNSFPELPDFAWQKATALSVSVFLNSKGHIDTF